jgi:hypothetical protein
VAGRVDDVDPHFAIADGRVLGHDRDALLALEIDRVEYPLAHLLVGAEYAALPEHGVDQRCLAVVDVGDDRQVSEVGSRLFGHGTRAAGWICWEVARNRARNKDPSTRSPVPLDDWRAGGAGDEEAWPQGIASCHPIESSTGQAAGARR